MSGKGACRISSSHSKLRIFTNQYPRDFSEQESHFWELFLVSADILVFNHEFL